MSWSQVRAAAGRSRPRGRRATARRSGRPRASWPCAGGSSRRPWRSRSPGSRGPEPVGVGQVRTTVAVLVPGRSSGARPRPAARPSSPLPAPARAAARPRPTLSSGSRVPMIPVEGGAIVASSMPSADAASIAATSAWSASPSAPVAAFAQPLVETIAVAQPKPPAPPVGGREVGVDRRTGAAANAFGVNTAPRPPGPRRRSDERAARSGRPEALIPAAPPPATNPAGMRAAARPAGRTGESAGSGTSGDRSSVIRSWCERQLLEAAAVSGRPKTRLNAWTAWPAAPLTRLSIDADREDPAGALVDADVTRAWLLPRTCLVAGRSRDDRHERLVGVGRGVQVVELGLAHGRVGRTWQADRIPRVIGMRWGRKSMPVTPGLAPPPAAPQRPRVPAPSRLHGDAPTTP